MTYVRHLEESEHAFPAGAKTTAHLKRVDPPAWGIGASGEKWKLEDKIDELMMTASSLLAEDGFLIMNTYSPTVDTDFLTELIDIYFPSKKSSISQLYMETKTEKTMYFGELVRIQ